MKHARTLLGMGVMIVLPLAATILFPDFGASKFWDAVHSLLELFLGAVAGAWLARRPFVIPALVVWAMLWIVVTWLLHGYGGRTGDASVAAILQYNWLAIVLSGIGAVTGALCGQVMARAQPA